MSRDFDVNRRNFVKVTAAAGAVLASAGAVPVLAMPTPKPDKWDNEADVIIVGGGAAGLAAACEAVDKGLSAILLEKQATLGGSTIICGGQMSFAGTPDQKEKGINDSVELFTKDLLEVGGHVNDPALIKAYMDIQLETYDWLKGMGVQISNPRPNSGMSVPRGHYVSPPQFITMTQKYAVGKGAKILLSCAAQRLVYDDASKKIVGLTSKFRNRETTFGAKKAVILAAGGYCRNPDLLAQYTPLLRKAKVIAGLGTQGDGIKMVLAYGADFIDTPYVKATYGVTMNPSIFNEDYMQYYYSGAVILNKAGKRIVNESISYKLLGDAALAQEDGCGFQVFDSIIREAEYERRRKNPEAVAKFENRPGILYKADTINEAAKQAGIDAEAAEETVKRYNGYVKSGNDAEFGRKHLSGNFGELRTIEKPPFYIMPSTAAIIGTYSGVRITPKAEIVDIFGDVIPGVLAAGEMTGGFHGAAYMTGTAFGKATMFGRIAARTAAGM
jgi:fumarate reductase flavoprotein subunit